MVNTKEFTKRLEKIINFYGLSASSFADKIGVQRSSISHILSGRNKPSLEFVMKVLSPFPEVDLYWLLNGKGEFPKNAKSKPEDSSLNQVKEKIFSEHKNTTSITEIERIVIFYKDGSFKNFENS